jgi:hypothetical protein
MKSPKIRLVLLTYCPKLLALFAKVFLLIQITFNLVYLNLFVLSIALKVVRGCIERPMTNLDDNLHNKQSSSPLSYRAL